MIDENMSLLGWQVTSEEYGSELYMREGVIAKDCFRGSS